jgi:hypothetical protein
MMAKRPEDRYQTPASVGLALLPFTRRMPTLSRGTLPVLKGTLPAPSADTPLPSGLARGDEDIFRMPGRNAASDALSAKVK